MVRLMELVGALALWMLFASAAAGQPPFLFDNLAASKVTAKTSDYDGYYAESELACLKHTSIKNCRYTGCPVEQDFDSCNNNWCYSCQPDSLYFQTDFSCCQKEHSYSYGAHGRVNDFGFDSKIGTCDWEISLYRCGGSYGGGLGNTGSSDPWCPHYTEDGTAVRWGTAWGTCYLNAQADHCDHPLCDRMVMSIQGGLYASCAYSPEAYGSELWDPFWSGPNNQFCQEERDIDDGILRRYRQLQERVQELRRPSGTGAQSGSAANTTPAFILQDGASVQQAAGSRQQLVAGSFDGWLQYIWTLSAAYLEDICAAGDLGPDRRTADPAQQPGPERKTPVQAKLANYDHDHTHQYYRGMALMLSGPMYITSKREKKVEETGMFEMTLAYRSGSPLSTVQDPINNWPVVHGYSSKARFTTEKDDYYAAAADQPVGQ